VEIRQIFAYRGQDDVVFTVKREKRNSVGEAKNKKGKRHKNRDGPTWEPAMSPLASKIRIKSVR